MLDSYTLGTSSFKYFTAFFYIVSKNLKEEE